MVLSLRSSQLRKMASAFQVGFDNFHPGTYQGRVAGKPIHTFNDFRIEETRRGKAVEERWLQGLVAGLAAARRGALVVSPAGKERARPSPSLAPSGLARAH